jgi:REP element-mobilizing transposase RayT
VARPLRIAFPGALYHVTSRGNARAPIYLDDHDRSRFLVVVQEVVERHHWRCYAYCLMTNHYHLVVDTPLGNLSAGMRQLNGVYTQAFNRRHARVGHLFQGRFSGILVERVSHLLELARYVVLNPVRAGMVGAPEDYRWSSLRATLGRSPLPSWLEAERLLQTFNSPARYLEFVREGAGLPSPWSALRGSVLGSDAFARAHTAQGGAPARAAEAPRRERLAGRPRLEQLFAVAGGNRGSRDAQVREANRRHGYSLAEIARHLGLHYSTISRIAAADASAASVAPPAEAEARASCFVSLRKCADSRPDPIR